MKVVGIKGLGVVWETEIDERCNENGVCKFQIIWCTNFKLSNGNVVFRKLTENYYGNEGNEDVDEELEYYYVNGNVLDSKFKLPYVVVNDNNTKEVRSEEIDVIEQVWGDLEWSDEIDFQNDCGFDEVDEEELNEILGN